MKPTEGKESCELDREAVLMTAKYPPPAEPEASPILTLPGQDALRSMGAELGFCHVQPQSPG